MKFSHMYIENEETKELINIKNLEKEDYEKFLEYMHQLRIAYIMIAGGGC